MEGEARISAVGHHNGLNAMAAVAVASCFGVTPEELWKALPSCELPPGRCEWIDLDSGARVLFDAYNANPESMDSFLKTFAEQFCEGKKGLVLGEMHELGEFTKFHHEELGKKASEQAVDWVWFIGKSAKDFQRGFKKGARKPKLIISENFDPACALDLKISLGEKSLVGVKGSRGAALEVVLQAWQEFNS